MKNIYLIPTEKPSRLHLWFDINSTRLEFCKLEYSHTKNTQHIYITANEEIKEGDWFINESNQIEKGIEYYDYKILSPESKKIILTTDQDLISESVQAIDDEFLEWFVKNPTCENVKVEIDLHESQLGNGYSFDKNIYKIIIPQEEPKQETLEEAAEDYAKQFSDEYSSSEIDFIAGAKWQAERMYSEEEVKHIISEALQSALVTVDLEQWFEQFKKK